MKKHVLFTILILMALILGSVASVEAEIIPPYGEGQIGLQAVVLCESLTVREAPRTNAGILDALEFGRRIIVMKQENGWAYICTSDDVDASPAGYVRTDYIVIDPAWYKADAETPVYAWNDTAALKVALLDKGTTLPILKDYGDWLVVSLRGASGWIRK